MQRAVGRGVDGRAVRAVASLPVGRIWDEKARRRYAFNLAQQAGLQEADANDIAQTVMVKLLDEHEPSPALVKTATMHAMVDRARSKHFRAGKLSEPIDDMKGRELTVEPDPGEALLRQRVRQECARLMPEMPSAPRWVIERVYLQSMELEDVVKAREAESGPLPTESTREHHKRSKDWVYKNHERGLAWLREHIAL